NVAENQAAVRPTTRFPRNPPCPTAWRKAQAAESPATDRAPATVGEGPTTPKRDQEVRATDVHWTSQGLRIIEATHESYSFAHCAPVNLELLPCLPPYPGFSPVPISFVPSASASRAWAEPGRSGCCWLW